MSSPVARFRPSRRYVVYAALCGLGAAGSAWAAAYFGIAWLAAMVSFLAAAFAMMALMLRPAIEVHNAYLAVGRHIIFWNEIHRVDRTRWSAPLLVRLTLADNRRVYVLHPGDQESSIDLLRHLFRNSRQALLDGVAHGKFWGEPQAAAVTADPAPRGRLLLPEDEAEVERLFQRLKTVGRLDQRGSSDE